MYRSALSFVDNAGKYDRAVYQRGIRILRETTGHGRDRDQWLSRSALPPNLREPMQVEVLAPYTPNVSIGVRMRTSDVYVTSVHNRHAGFYFEGNQPVVPPKTHEVQVVLPFTDHYNDLGKFVSLNKIDLGTVDGAIAAISNWTPSTRISNRVTRADGSMAQSPEARQLLVLCLILSESIRFHRIEETVANALGGIPNSPMMLRDIDELVRDWSKLSRAGGEGVAVQSEG